MNFGDSPSYSGTSTFRGAQHPRLLSGSTEPNINEQKPYGPKPILYPVPMQNRRDMSLSSAPYLAPVSRQQIPPQNPYIIPAQPVAQKQKPVVQYVCNRGVASAAAPTAPATTAAPVPPTPACSSCGKKSCGCRQSHHKCRMPARKMREYEEDDDYEDEEDYRASTDRKKKRKSTKKSAATTTPPPPAITPYTSNMLTPTGMGVVSSILGAYGSGFGSSFMTPYPPTGQPSQTMHPSNLGGPGQANAYNALYGRVPAGGQPGAFGYGGQVQNIAGVNGPSIAPAKFQNIPQLSAGAAGGAGGATQPQVGQSSADFAAASMAQQQSFMQQQMYMQQMMQLQQDMQQPENQNPLTQQDIMQQYMALQQKYQDTIDKVNNPDNNPTPYVPSAPQTAAPDQNNPIATGIITNSAVTGDSLLHLQIPAAVQIGVFVSISNGANSEAARIAKLSPGAGIYIDQPIKGNYPAGTPVYFFNKMPKLQTISPVCATVCNSKCTIAGSSMYGSVKKEYKYSDMCNCSYEVCGETVTNGPTKPNLPDCSFTFVDGNCNPATGMLVSMPQLVSGQMPGTNCSPNSISSILTGVMRNCSVSTSTTTPASSYYSGTTTPASYYSGTTTPGPTYYSGTTTTPAGTTGPATQPISLILYYPFNTDFLNYATGTGVVQGEVYTPPGTTPMPLSNTTYKTGNASLKSNEQLGTRISSFSSTTPSPPPTYVYTSSSWFNITKQSSIPSNRNGYSFSFWVYPMDTSSNSGMIFSMNTSSNTRIFMDISNGNVEIGTTNLITIANTPNVTTPGSTTRPSSTITPDIITPSSTTVPRTSTVTIGVANKNNWTHYTWTISPTGESKVYINGNPVQLQGSVPYINGTIQTAYILGDPMGPNFPGMVGYIDEFRYYDGILTPFQIANLPGVKFSPLLQGCSMWMDAADPSAIVVDSDGYVSKWVDKSTPQSSIIFTQNIPMRQPQAAIDPVLKLPVINFNSGNKTFLGGPSTGYNIGTNCYALFMVFKYIDTTSSGYIFSKTKISTDSSGKIIAGRDNYNKIGNLSFFVADSTHVNMNYSDTTPANSYRIISMIYNRNGGNASVYSNGVLGDSFNFTPNTSEILANMNNMIIGAKNNDSGSISPPKDGSYLNGSIAELISYTNPYDMSGNMRQQIEGYLAWKWGLQSLLPSGAHQYSSIPPSVYTPFSPLQINTTTMSCILWLDAADKNTQFPGNFGDNSLAYWSDKSGANNNFTVTDKPPQVNLKTINGLPVVDFTSYSGNSYMYNKTIKMANSYTIFAVGYTTVNAANTYSRLLNGMDYSFNLVLKNDIVLKNDNLLFMGAKNGISATGLGTGTGWKDTTINPNTQSTGAPTGQPTPNLSVNSTLAADQLCIMGIVNNTQSTPNMYPYQNGVLLTSKSASGTSFTGLSLGGKFDGISTITEPWNGIICEVLIYNDALSPTQRQQIEGYLAWKWGLQSKLPTTGHLYKNSPV